MSSFIVAKVQLNEGITKFLPFFLFLVGVQRDRGGVFGCFSEGDKFNRLIGHLCCARHLKNGLSHTEGAGLSHTEGGGVSHTVSEVTSVMKKGFRFRCSRGKGDSAQKVEEGHFFLRKDSFFFGKSLNVLEKHVTLPTSIY